MKMENLSNIQNVKLQNVLDQLISSAKSYDHSFQGCRNDHAVDLSQHCESFLFQTVFENSIFNQQSF